MRVLLVVHGYPPAAIGGTEIYTRELARALRDAGADVHVLAREAEAARPEHAVRAVLDEQDRIPIWLVNNTYRECRSFEETYRRLAIRAAAARVLDEVQPEVVHIEHLTGLSLDLVFEIDRRNIPVLFTLHDYWLICHRGQLLDVDGALCPGPQRGCGRCLGAAGAGLGIYAAARLLRRIAPWLPRLVASELRRRASRIAPEGDRTAQRRLILARAVARRVTLFLAPSRTVRDRLVEQLGIDRERTRLVEQGVARSTVVRSGSAAARGPLRFGFLGSLMLSKAPHLALEAFAGLPPGRATLDLWGEIVPYHGDDSYRARLAPLLASPGVRHRGPVAHEPALAALLALDVLVVPSIWLENAPFVIREAFAAGVPVIAANRGGMAELVEHERSGLLFEPGDALDLRRAMQRLLDEPALLERLRGGLPRVMSIDEDAAQLLALYRDATAGPRVARPRLAAVVLNYCTPHDTLLAARSLQSSQRPVQDLIVVDNASPDGSAAFLRARLPESRAEVIASPRNLGFPGGCNLGVRRALERGAQLVFLLNGDAMVASDTLGRLEEALETGYGIAGPVVLARSDPSTIASAGIAFSRATGRMRHLQAGARYDPARPPPSVDAAAVSGCAMLVRRDVLERVGLLDEDYFFSFEDIDLCLRARAHDLRTRVVGDAVAYHQGSQSIGPRSPRRLYFAARNHLLAADRAAHVGTLHASVRAAAIVALNLAHALRARESPRLAGCRAVVRGTLDHLRGARGSRWWCRRP